MKRLDETASGGEIQMDLGESFEIQLQENRTAGYKWFLESSDHDVCKMIDDAFERGQAIGQPGVHRWQFRVERAGSTTIQLSYRRPWEDDAKPTRTFTLRVRVSD